MRTARPEFHPARHARTARPPGDPRLEPWVRELLALWRRGNSGAQSTAPELTREELGLLRSSLRRLTRGLGATRKLAGVRYLDDRGMLGAYLLYYWPVSYAQVSHCLAQAGFGSDAPPVNALDLGCGPGPGCAALSDAGARNIVALDRSASALESLRRLLGRTKTRVTARTWDAHASQAVPTGTFDCIVASHLLNELWRDKPDRIERRTALLRQALAHLSPSGALVLIEPALHAAARELLAVRDGLLAQGAWIDAPCTTQQGCPGLHDDRATCHVAVPWRPPRLLEGIAEDAGPHREALKMAYLVVRNAPPMNADTGALRVVSDPMRNKAGRIRMLVCGGHGRFAISADPRQDTAPVRAFVSLRRGDLVHIENPENRGEGWGISSATAVRRLKRNA